MATILSTTPRCDLARGREGWGEVEWNVEKMISLIE